MLRQQGLTPNELASRYERYSRLPYGAVDMVRLFGEPPYEFLGDAGERNWPNYRDFAPQYTDSAGRQYQRTDESPRRYFVRLPLSVTRSVPANATYEQYLRFPVVNELVHMSSATHEVHARVTDCPFDARRAVSNVYFDDVAIVAFTPDFVDTRGRQYMRCVRNRCFLAAAPDDDADADQLPALYYVRLPDALLSDKRHSARLKRALRARARGDENSGGAAAGAAFVNDSASRVIAHQFIATSRPYDVVDGDDDDDDKDDDTQSGVSPRHNSRRQRHAAAVATAASRLWCERHVADDVLSHRSATPFPRRGEVIDAYQAHAHRTFSLEVADHTADARHCCARASSMVALRLLPHTARTAPPAP